MSEDYLGKKLDDLRAEDEKSDDRKDFIETFKEIQYYGYSKDYKDKVYSPMQDYFADLKPDQMAKINRAAEYVEIVGSYLHPNNPDAQVNSREGATFWQKKRHKLEERVLDLNMEECDLKIHGRRAVDEALMSGRGMLWYGWNDRKGMPQATFGTVEDFGWDSKAKTTEEIGYCWRKRTKPKWQLKSLYSDAVDKIQEQTGDKKPNDAIDYYEFYFRVDPQNYCDEMDEEQPWDGVPKVLIVLGKRVIHQADWAIRFDKIDRWPFNYMDYRQRPGRIYPAAPMEPGICHLRNICWIYSLYVHRVMETSKVAWAMMENGQVEVSDQAAARVVNPSTRDGLTIRFKTSNPDIKIGDVFQRLTLDTPIQEFDRAIALYDRLWQDATGLNDLVRTGQDTNQIRTAADADMKSKRSLTRIDDMKAITEQFLTDTMNMLAFAERSTLFEEDITKRFGPEMGALWGTVDETGELVVQEQQQRAMAKQQMMTVDPNAELQAMQMGMPPPQPMTDEQAEEQLGPPQWISLDEWINEASREIVAGSMRPIDHDAQVDNLSFALVNTSAIFQGMPTGQRTIAQTWLEFVRTNKYSLEMIAEAEQTLRDMTALAAKNMEMAMMPPPPMVPPGAPVPGPGANAPKPTPEPDQGMVKAIKGPLQ
jgi:hypothetical protein